MPTFRTTLTSALTAIALAGGLAVGASDTAHADTCNADRTAKISGAEAAWSLTCTSTGVKLSGWLEDTRTDGRCAKVRIVGGNGTPESKEACGSGTREQFDFTFNGTNKAQVRLATV
ncbi:hypothetical protein ABZ802_08350 [Streptomyces sp. NPDC047737]|jgi:hypothetical protein|uniref:hypothetical protein n=1 Tax=unclassified Streptomyces TaxID=2593676 RepID=UPI0033D8A4BE